MAGVALIEISVCLWNLGQRSEEISSIQPSPQIRFQKSCWARTARKVVVGLASRWSPQLMDGVLCKRCRNRHFGLWDCGSCSGGLGDWFIEFNSEHFGVHVFEKHYFKYNLLSQSKAFFHNMPLDFATTVDKNKYIEINQHLQSMTYWWGPDSSLVLYEPAIAELPPWSLSE